MSRNLLFSVFTATAITGLAIGCATPASQDLSDAEYVALDAAIMALDPVRAELPIADQDLFDLGVEYVSISRDYMGCEVEGVISGVWYDEGIAPVFEGSWFELGTGDLGGTVEGLYGDGEFEGDVSGPSLDGSMMGYYDGGDFVGQWDVVNDDGTSSQGELAGHYERRNSLGGYFFGLWGHCYR